MLGSLCRNIFTINKCRSPFLTNLSRTRSVRSATRPAGPSLPATPTKQRLFWTVIRCPLFACATVTGLSCGSVILEYEMWRSKALSSRGDSPQSGVVKLFRRVRRDLESILGRSLKATDVFWAIVALNVLVFLGYRTPLAPFFARYFYNSAYGATPALSMLLSVFSHVSFLHLAINMYVLHSFTPTLISTIGPGEYITLFVGGGVFASLLSVLSMLGHRIPIASLGSSGGICAVLGAFSMLKPEAQLCIPFVVDVYPHSFSAYTTCWVMLGLELTATVFLFGRSYIDHAAHLGGLIFGMYYGMAGVDEIWKRRSFIITKWTEWRGR